MFDEPKTDENHANTRIALIRIMMSFYQIIGIFVIIQANWNASLRTISRTDESATIGHSDVLSLDCAYSEYGPDTDMKRIYMKTILTDTLVLFYWLIAFIAVIIYHKVRKFPLRGPKSNFKSILCLTLFSIFYNYQANLMR